jgi:hypothetical protein
VNLIDNRFAKLSPATVAEIQNAFLQRPHEFVTVNPYIKLTAVIDTGSIIIKCKEVVRLSEHLMALATGATFSVQLTAKARTAAQHWEEAITAGVCRSAQSPEGIQPIHTMEAVQQAVALLTNGSPPADLDEQVDRYMEEEIGVVDSALACDPEFLRPHAEALRLICLGKKHMDGDAGGIRQKMAKLHE